MKRIGILGGMGPKSTVSYYEYIVEAYHQKFGDYAFPEMIIYSLSLQHFIDLFEKRSWETVLDEVIGALDRLYKAGAEFGIIATNTLHVVFEKAQQKSPLPLISIMDSVKDAIKNERINKVGLLSTVFTMNESFYPNRLANHGIETLLPIQEDRHRIQHIITTELTMGQVTKESKAVFLRIVDDLVKKGAQGIILGCTEIPLLVNQGDCSVKMFDSTSLHAEAALKYALK